MMKCNHIRSKLIDFIDEALYPAERKEVEQHLRLCDPCHAAWREAKAFSDTCAEFIVYPDKPYSFAVLRTRMATVRPLDEIRAFLPRMRAQGVVTRWALASLMLLFALALPTSVRGVQETGTAVKQSFDAKTAKWEYEYQDELDRQYRLHVATHNNPQTANNQRNSA